MSEGTPIPLNRLTAPLGQSNAVLHARSRVHFVREFPGPLSIKSVKQGTVAWQVGGRCLPVDADSFLVLREGEPYSMNIESRTPVETMCVFFEPGFVESVHASIATHDLEPAAQPVDFIGGMYLRDARILPRLHGMESVTEEHYLELAADLALLDRDLQRRLRLLPARRPGTREELFRRVRRAQEYLHAHATSGDTLTALARQACLSPYHFHRAFTAAFGRTPQQYRTGLRLAQARRLLETTEMTVTDICGAVGFESAASFSLLFRRFFSVTPTAARKIRKLR